MLLDTNGNVITHGGYIAHDLDETLTTEDLTIWRCASCQTYLKPSEVGIAKRRVKDTINNVWTFEVAQICPACHPDPTQWADEHGEINTDFFFHMSREEYHLMRKRESSQIIVAN